MFDYFSIISIQFKRRSGKKVREFSVFMSMFQPGVTKLILLTDLTQVAMASLNSDSKGLGNDSRQKIEFLYPFENHPDFPFDDKVHIQPDI